MPNIVVNEDQMFAVFKHLIGNAIKFRDPERAALVRVASHPRADHWVIEVEDNGLGIPRADIEEVFMIFQRVHPDHDFPGYGVGLSLCKSIVERHGGTIWMDSEPGRGTTVHFTLPRREEE